LQRFFVFSDSIFRGALHDAERFTAIAIWAYQQAVREHARLWRGIDQFVDVTAPSADIPLRFL